MATHRDDRPEVSQIEAAQLLLADAVNYGPGSRDLGVDRVIAIAAVHAQLAIAEAMSGR